MFVIPDEYILYTSTECVSPYSNLCYLNFNKKIPHYLEVYKLLMTKLPSEIVRIIMAYCDPRNENIHVLGKNRKKINIRGKLQCYRQCYRCYQKIIS